MSYCVITAVKSFTRSKMCRNRVTYGAISGKHHFHLHSTITNSNPKIHFSRVEKCWMLNGQSFELEKKCSIRGGFTAAVLVARSTVLLKTVTWIWPRRLLKIDLQTDTFISTLDWSDFHPPRFDWLKASSTEHQLENLAKVK